MHRPQQLALLVINGNGQQLIQLIQKLRRQAARHARRDEGSAGAQHGTEMRPHHGTGAPALNRGRTRSEFCHPGPVESWTHADEVYEVNSMYLLPDSAWAYEMTPVTADRGRMSLIVLIPDATPDDGPFRPRGSTHAQVVLDDGDLPWPALSRFLQVVESSGDIVRDNHDVPVAGDLSSSCNAWHPGDLRRAHKALKIERAS
jgi:hypothetical protein